VLATLSVVGAALGMDWRGLSFAAFVTGDPQSALPHGGAWLSALSVALAGLGIAGAWVVYQRGAVSRARLRAAFGPLASAAEAGYGLDGAYAALYRGVVLGGAWVVGWLDRYLVDGVVNYTSAWTLRAGVILRALQTGRAQDYLYGVTAGFLLLVVLWWAWA